VRCQFCSSEFSAGYKSSSRRFCSLRCVAKNRWKRDKISNEDRFHLSYIRCANGCWEWLKARDKNGYGWFHIMRDGKKSHMPAHRFSITVSGRSIITGQIVMHSCDNPPCVNPGHLFVGTQRDNVLDSIRKGRHRHSKKIAISFEAV
jgi:hypothetical protein